MSTEAAPDALTSIAKLYDEMFADLDTAEGGCRWWHGYQDWKRLVLINDYGIGSVSKLRSTVELRDHHVKRFSERWTTENWRVVRGQAAGGDAYPLEGVSRKDEERRRDIEVAVRGFFDCAASSLDLLATLFIIVCAVKVKVQGAAWSALERCEKSVGQRQAKLLDAHGSEGRREQEEAVRTILDAAARTGPTGWLTWTLEMRNVLLHRGGRGSLAIQTHRSSKKARDLEMFQLAPIDPTASDVEAMAHSNHPRDIYQDIHIGDLMATIRSNLDFLVAEAVSCLEALWGRRRVTPTLLAQPGEQWPQIREPRTTPFDGDFDRIVWLGGPGSSLAVHPDEAARWEAAKLQDAEAGRHWGTYR